jgi:hypothetical protein
LLTRDQVVSCRGHNRTTARTVEFENTPKALANFSPGFEAKREPWDYEQNNCLNPARVPQLANPFRVTMNLESIPRVVACGSNPGLKLANAFGVIQTVEFIREPISQREAPRALFILVNQQLTLDCGNLCVNHAKAVQLTAASEGDAL